MASQSGSPRGPAFPDPVVVQPTLEHRQSIILLHGRGSNGRRFGTEGAKDKKGLFRDPLISTQTSEQETLQTAFPHAKIIFPSASRSPATIYGGSSIHQWFDNWHLEDRYKNSELQIEGLRASVEYVHGLVKEEIELVGSQNVVLWGLSQGSATSLASLLLWDGEPFAAVVGMCGWLPFDDLVGVAVRNQPRGGDVATPNAMTCGHCGEGFQSRSKLFKHLKVCDLIPTCGYCEGEFPSEKKLQDHLQGCPSKDHIAGKDLPPRGVTLLRKKLKMGHKKATIFRRIPVFLGHGTEDETVGIDLGRAAKIYLEMVGADVVMMEYEGLDHWTSPEMMADIFRFSKEKLGEQDSSETHP